MTGTSSKTSSPRGLSEKPIEILYKRWRHKTKNYTVTVFGVRNYLGTHGFNTVVVVHDMFDKESLWPATTFLATFAPIGRKLKIKRWWERL